MSKQKKKPAKGKEPQSYGSNKEWVAGTTAQTVNEQDGEPVLAAAAEEAAPAPESPAAQVQGGENSPRGPVADRAVTPPAARAESVGTASKKMQLADSRGSFFKNRDYKSH